MTTSTPTRNTKRIHYRIGSRRGVTTVKALCKMGNIWKNVKPVYTYSDHYHIYGVSYSQDYSVVIMTATYGIHAIIQEITQQ